MLTRPSPASHSLKPRTLLLHMLTSGKPTQPQRQFYCPAHLLPLRMHHNNFRSRTQAPRLTSRLLTEPAATPRPFPQLSSGVSIAEPAGQGPGGISASQVKRSSSAPSAQAIVAIDTESLQSTKSRNPTRLCAGPAQSCHFPAGAGDSWRQLDLTPPFPVTIATPSPT